MRVLTSRVGLRRLFGDEGRQLVESRAWELLPRWSDGEAFELRFLEELDPRKDLPADLKAVLILGGTEVVPHVEIENPVRSRRFDPDPTVVHDDAYGGGLEGVPVGRLPDFGASRLRAFLDVLDASADNPPVDRRSIAVSNQAWARATEQVFAGHGGPLMLRTSPGWNASDPDWRRQRSSFLYFNLHGFSDRAEWRGFDARQGRWVDAVLPSQVDEQAVRQSVVVAENCYGANVGARPSASVAGRMLEVGARAFIGSTGLAYSSHSPIHAWALGNADAFGRELVNGLASQRIGEALWRAKNAVAAMPGPYAEKTAKQFVLYGNPLARS